MSAPRAGPRFTEALGYAARLHAHQRRKGTDIPYIAHLMGVASLVLEYGGDEDAAIAALLHDAAEDQGGAATLADIREKFGAAVAEIVESCSDTLVTPKPPWRKRKEAYLAHLADAGAAARLVSAADKVHNARAILADYRQVGEAVWGRFSGGRDGTLWYYQALVTALRAAGGGVLVDELERVVNEIVRLAAAAE